MQQRRFKKTKIVRIALHPIDLDRALEQQKEMIIYLKEKEYEIIK